MSAFLGPIHYWLFNKIQLQEKLVQSILAAGENIGAEPGLSEKVNAACGVVDTRPLEESIDTSNIHGSLQQKIQLVEARLAFVVTELLQKNPECLPKLEKIAYEFGKQHSAGPELNAQEGFQALSDRLIDGMPCDHVNMLLQQEEQVVSWRQTQCVHHAYWERVGGDVAVYYRLRTQMIKGMLAESGLQFIESENGVYEIRGE